MQGCELNPTAFQSRVSKQMFSNIMTKGISEMEAEAGSGKSLAQGMCTALVNYEHRKNNKKAFTIVTSGAKTIESSQVTEFGCMFSDSLKMSNRAQVAEVEKKLAKGDQVIVHMSYRSIFHAFGGVGDWKMFGEASPQEVESGVKDGVRIPNPPMVELLLKHKVDELLLVIDEHQFLYRAQSHTFPSIMANLRAFARRRNERTFNTRISMLSKGPDLDNSMNATVAMALVYQGIEINRKTHKEHRPVVDKARDDIVCFLTDEDKQEGKNHTKWMTDCMAFDGTFSTILQTPTDPALKAQMLDNFSIGQLIDSTLQGNVYDAGLKKPLVVYSTMPKTQKHAYAVTPQTVHRSMNGLFATADAASFMNNRFLPGNGNYAFNPRTPARVSMRKVVGFRADGEPITKSIMHYHSVLCVIGTNPSTTCREHLSSCLKSSHKNVHICDYMNVSERDLEDNILIEARTVFESDEKMLVVFVTEQQIHGSNAFSFFTASVLFGCCNSQPRNKYFQEQCHNRLARRRVVRVGDVVPNHNSFQCIHIASEITAQASQNRRGIDLKRCIEGGGRFGGDIGLFSSLYERLSEFGLEEKFARNFFSSKGGVTTPLTLDGLKPEYLGDRLLSFAKQRKDNSDSWNAGLIDFMKKVITLQDDEFEVQDEHE